MIMPDLQNLIIKFVQSNQSNLQFDFYSRNQIVLQIYKISDVKNWGFGIEKQIIQDLIIELTFNKQKIDNDINKARFIKSNLFDCFYKFETIKEDSYWTGIDSKQDLEQIEKQILEIIDTVYSLKGEKIEYTLNAF